MLALRCWVKAAHRVCKRLVSSQPEPEHLLLHVESGVLSLVSFVLGEKHVPLWALVSTSEMEAPIMCSLPAQVLGSEAPAGFSSRACVREAVPQRHSRAKEEKRPPHLRGSGYQAKAAHVCFRFSFKSLCQASPGPSLLG